MGNRAGRKAAPYDPYYDPQYGMSGYGSYYEPYPCKIFISFIIFYFVR